MRKPKKTVVEFETPSDEKLDLLHAGILVTENAHPKGPLEKILLVNRGYANSPATFETLQPKPSRLKAETTISAASEDPSSFGYGPYYIDGFHPDPPHAPFLNPDLPLPDNSIAPQNADPVHDPLSQVPGYEDEKIAGTKWLLQNLQCGSLISLADEYYEPSISDDDEENSSGNDHTIAPPPSPILYGSIGYRRKWGKGNIRSEMISTEIIPKPHTAGYVFDTDYVSPILLNPGISYCNYRGQYTRPPTREIHVNNADPSLIPEELLDPIYTLRFREHDLLSEPLPYHETHGMVRIIKGDEILTSRKKERPATETQQIRRSKRLDVMDRASDTSKSKKKSDKEIQNEKLSQMLFPALPCTFNTVRPISQRSERWSLEKRLASVNSWKKEVEWAKGHSQRKTPRK
jgi:hypothetical protein